MSSFNQWNFCFHKFLSIFLILLSITKCSTLANQRLSTRTIKTKYGTLRGIIINQSSSSSDKTYLQPVEAFLGK